MTIQIVKVNDELLSSSRYEIYIDKKLYVGNLTHSGLEKWKAIINKKD